MAITRIQYITVAELNEVLGTAFTDDASTNLLIKEASELISYHTIKNSDNLFNQTTPDTERLDLLKIATAYQVKYVNDIPSIDDEYEDEGSSYSSGSYSESKTSAMGGKPKEYKKIAPKTNRYLTLAGLLYKGADSRSGFRGANIIE